MSTDSETSSQSVDRDSGSKRSTNEEVDGTGVDRISDLPESLLLHILSFLSVIFVVRTSVLSRRWKNLWTCVPCLRFGSEPGERSEIFVNKVLLQYTATSIRKFRLGYGLQDFSAMESWIRWALDRNVEELNLSLHWWISNLEPYPHHLPETIFGCKTLVVLTLKNLDVRMAFPPSACIPCLKTLELDSLRYEDDEFESKLISCCVVLENLSIRKDACGYLDDICIHLQQLKRLKIGIYQEREYGYNGAQYVIDINAPNLQDLDIEDDGLCSPLLANVGILSKAKINLNCSNAFRSILKCFSAFKIVKSFHLSSSYVRQTCILKPGFTVHNVNLTRLTIGARSVWVQLLPYFFHCFPNLEVLTLTEEKSACKHARKLRTHLKLLPTGLLSRLRVFVAHEFWGTNNEIGMLKYIMKNSQVLDSVGLHYITDPRGTTKMLQVAQTIINFQKASQKCRIKFF